MMKHTQLRLDYRSYVRERNLILWSVLAIFLAILPFMSSDYALNIFSQMCIYAVFALSYNMLLGQGGMLSFGHAVFFGLGGFFVIHALKMIEGSGLYIPVVFTPLIGGIFGMIAGTVIGSFSTRRGHTVFAMITLGIAELVVASAVVFVSFFGGEEGKEGDRTEGPSSMGFLTDWFGIEWPSLAQQIEVYYFAAFWFIVAAILMYAFSRTPAGRMANAVRDNPERAEFIGYNPRLVRFVSFVASGFFAGLAGGLFAIQYEIVTSLDIARASGEVLLQTYIGGAMYFIGPIIGTIIIVLLQSVVSGMTELSALYAAILFVVVVLALPVGVTGLIMMHGPSLKSGRIRYLILPYLIMLIPLVLAFTGSVGLIEMVHFIEKAGVGETEMKLFGTTLNVAAIWVTPVPWLVFGFLAVVGFIGCFKCKQYVTAAWEKANDPLVSSLNEAPDKKSEAAAKLVKEEATV